MLRLLWTWAFLYSNANRKCLQNLSIDCVLRLGSHSTAGGRHRSDWTLPRKKVHYSGRPHGNPLDYIKFLKDIIDLHSKRGWWLLFIRGQRWGQSFGHRHAPMSASWGVIPKKAEEELFISLQDCQIQFSGCWSSWMDIFGYTCMHRFRTSKMGMILTLLLASGKMLRRYKRQIVMT